MRFWPLFVGLAACSVPDKEPLQMDAGGDAGMDAPVDDTVPETTIDEAPVDITNKAQATFRFSSNVADATFECRLDMDAREACTSPFVRTLSDGAHTFSVRAIARSGISDDTPAERVWTIDTVAPQTMLLGGPPAADNSVMASFKFKSNEDNAEFDCSLDNAGYLPCESGDSFGPVGDGAHSFAVRARDRAGNVDASPAVYAWSVDTATPDTQIVSGPSGPTGTTSASFTFVSPDAGAGATFQCALDGAAFAACSSPQSYSTLSEGPHTFAVRVKDAVGNLDPTPATASWTVDLTPPETTITGGPSGMVAVASASFTFASSEPDSTFSCSLDGAPAAACTSPFTATGLAQGSHTFSVRARDAANHDDPTPATRMWSIDTVPPDVMITMGPASGSTSGPRVTFAFTASDGAVTCSLDAAPFAPCTSPFAQNLPAGMHAFSVRAVDGAGNATTVTRSWTVACTAPDATGAAGLLHLDDTMQTLANGVNGGASATLGDTTMVEPGDPTATMAGRFAGALAFTASENDHVTWPVALPNMPDVTIELWVNASAAAGTHDLVVSADGRVAVREVALSPTTVAIIATIGEGGPGGKFQSVTSAAVAAGAWHHVLVSLHDPNLRLWVDGVRTDAAANLKSPLVLDSLRLGGAGFGGMLDEVWLAQTAITTDEPALQRYCPVQ